VSAARSRWLDEDTWVCLKHAPSLILPSSQEKCWLCKDQRPELILFSPKKEEKDKQVLITCAWEDCLNPPSSTSKYCSRNCSNKNARKRYNRRKSKNSEIK
jgi:hypothetical protein